MSVDDILKTLSQNKAIIGCQRGTTGQYYIEGDASWGFEGITNSTCKAFDNGSLAVQALSNNQIDAVIIDEVPASLYCKEFNDVKCLNFVFTQEEYAIAVAKGNITLVNSLNEFIDKIRKDGTFDSIVGKYYA
jgi:polar amino acid transport system substrate-binding protein